MELSHIALFFTGAVLLIIGAEALVRGASRLAEAVGVSPLIIGLTVVAIGTSAPEVAIALRGALTGQGDISLGNVVGANILNLLVILGAAAFVRPIIVDARVIRVDAPLMIGANVLLLLLARDGRLAWIEGLILLAALVAYLRYTVRSGRSEVAEAAEVVEPGPDPTASEARRRWPLHAALVVIGLLLLSQGSRFLLDAAVAIARALGVSELIIGLTIVSLGTTLPETATAVLSGLRGRMDLAVGNAVGSVIFNSLGVLGLATVARAGGLPVPAAYVHFDIPVMIAVGVACLPVFMSDCRISRWEGAFFLAYYGAYVLYLFLASTRHDALPAFSRTMIVFVLPITVIALAAKAYQSLRDRDSCRVPPAR